MCYNCASMRGELTKQPDHGSFCADICSPSRCLGTLILKLQTTS
ncbi:Protein of unknown function [Pyronema omphalodes CBS 100304]|uniref:Uncharacterized protein n=1 Tax=Pyronema omphalodes (strain CBS 100304) TaxID=1076935 RepID=U4LG33_PYROM|nr:Protein of unknown function [Pyronema omphalodes CBS 100304]